MANITVNLGSPVTGNYKVTFRDDNGVLLSSPYLTQNQVISLSNASVATITVGNGVYSLDNINIRLEALADSECNDEINTDLDVNCPVTVCTVSINNVSEQCVSNAVNIIVSASTTGGGTLQYAITTGSTVPTTWQSINQFSSLLTNTTYHIYVRNTENPTGCFDVYDYTTGVCTPNCGCSDLSSFSIDSITRVGTTNNFQVVFNGCNLTIANWRVKTI